MNPPSYSTIQGHTHTQTRHRPGGCSNVMSPKGVTLLRPLGHYIVMHNSIHRSHLTKTPKYKALGGDFWSNSQKNLHNVHTSITFYKSWVRCLPKIEVNVYMNNLSYNIIVFVTKLFHILVLLCCTEFNSREGK